MTTALIVDDSKVDQHFVASVINRAGIDTLLADDGQAALSTLEKRPVDLIITDMLMPRLDGLEFVKAVRKTDPLVPIILITAHGSEELAMKALRAGASSYGPKRQIARDLPEVIEQVLALAINVKNQRAAVKCLLSTQCSLVLSNDHDAVGPVIHHLRGEAARMNLCDEAELNHLALALHEALVNAIDHGNLEADSSQRVTDPPSYFRTIQERRSQPLYADRRVHVTASFSRELASIHIRDDGPGFDIHSIPDPTDPENLTKPFGRGLFLIHTFTDEVRHNATGNEITLIKRHARATDPVADRSRGGVDRF